MITQTHRLDVVPGGITTVVHVKQYQTDESLVFDLFSRFGDFAISAAFTECTVRGTKSDGNGYSANATCDPSNNSVTVELTEQMTAVAGRQPYEITVTDSTGRMITTTFILDVHRAALDADTVESESVIREVDTVVEDYMNEHGLDYVQYPGYPDSKYGTAGQSLRTKGDGTTEWADVGLPTDEQTEEAITEWLNNHPEATTTVSDGSLTEVKFADSLKLKAIKDYVTPQMYGAKADGTTDDTAAIQAAVDSGQNVYFPKATYKSGTIYITGSELLINGGSSTVLFGADSGFTIEATAHDVVISNIKTRCQFAKGSAADTNVHIGINGATQSEYAAYNITVANCDFDGGVMGVAASNVKNLLIANCRFGSFVYNASDGAGGYGVLLQSCINVEILSCDFVMGKYGRHDVYLSIDQRKTNNLQCKNILIDHCSFNHAGLETDSGGMFYSPATQAVNVRTSVSTVVKDCYFESVTGAVSYLSENGNIDGAIFSGNTVNSPVRNEGSAETKTIISCLGTSNYSVHLAVSDIDVLNVPAGYDRFLNTIYCSVQVYACKIGPTRINCSEGVNLQVSDVITDIPYYFIRFNSAGETKGYCRNITFTALTGVKYYYASGATVSDGFLGKITKVLTESVTTNANGTVDSNTFSGGQLLFSVAKVLAVQSSVNSRFVFPYTYNGRYFFKVCKVADLAASANESQTLTIICEVEE